MQSSFIAVCSFCLNDTTSTNALILYGTEGCLFKLCLRKQCNHIVDKTNYYSNCVRASKYINKDNTERTFEEDSNDDCVIIFCNKVVDDDFQSAANTIISIVGNTLFNGLPDYNVVGDSLVPPSDNLDCRRIEYNANDNVSVESKLSENLSESISVNDYTKKYLIEGGTCDIGKKIPER